MIYDNIEKLLNAKKLNQAEVSNSVMAIIQQRVNMIKSEPDGIVRETMISNILIDITDY